MTENKNFELIELSGNAFREINQKGDEFTDFGTLIEVNLTLLLDTLVLTQFE